MVEAGMLMSSVGSAFSQWFFDLVIWIVVIIGLGFFGWKWYVNKMVYKYTFIEWYDEKNFKVRKAKLIKTKNGLKKFNLKGYDDPTQYMQISQPNGFFNGQPCRNVCWDGMGNLVYLQGSSITKDHYLETALMPMERTEAIDAQMESAEKGITMNTMLKWGMSIATIIIVMVMISVVMVAKYGFEQSSQFTSATTNMITISETQRATQELTRDNTIAMNNLASAYARLSNLSIVQEIGTK